MSLCPLLEYALEGIVVATRATYANRYISVLTLEGRKVTQPLLRVTLKRQFADYCAKLK